MKELIKILFFACLIFFCISGLSAQVIGNFDNKNCPQERITVHLSQESCFTGEILWFKIYCSSPVFPSTEISCLAFLELVSTENSAVVRKKIDLKHGEGAGEIEIPSDLASGLYYILAYTSWMKNFGEESFFRKEIVIINTNQPLKIRNDGLNSGMSPKVISSGIFDQSTLRVQTDKKEYSLRQKVRVTIDPGNVPAESISGSFSVSVHRREPSLKYFSVPKPLQSVSADSVSRLTLPDHDGIVLSGILSDQSGNGIGNALLVLSLPGPGTEIDSYITGKNGEFNFLLKPGEGEEDIVITLPGTDLKTELAEPFCNGFRNPPGNTLADLDSESVAYFREWFSCLQLQKRFNSQNFIRRKPVKSSPDSSLFYTKPYETIYPGNYIALDSLGEYFYELIPSVKLTARKDGYDIKVLDPRSLNYLTEKPAVFLDGVLFDDFGAIAGLNPSDIYRITVLPEAYYYKDMSFGGIVDIHTKKSDFSLGNAYSELTRFIYPKAATGQYNYLGPDYSANPLVEKIPDLRYLLDWEPYIRSDSTGIASVEFYCGDVKGTFDVRVTGISGKGDIFQAACEFLVK